MNFYPAIAKYDRLKFEKATGVPTIDTNDTDKFGKVSFISTIPKYDTLNFETLSSRPPVYKYDKSKFERPRDYPKNDIYDKSKFEKVSGTMYFVKNLDLRPKEEFDVHNLKCQIRDRKGVCGSYVKNRQNIAIRSPVKNNKGVILRAPFMYDSQEHNEEDYNNDLNSGSREDLTRIGRILDKAYGNVSEDYIDLSKKLLVREHSDIQPEFKLERKQQNQLLLELENVLQKPLVLRARKSLSNKRKRKKKTVFRKPKKTDLNITFTPLKYYRSVKSEESDSDEDNSENDEENEAATVKIAKNENVKIVDARDETIEAPLTLTEVSLSKKGKKNKKNRFNVIDNEKIKASKKKLKDKHNSNDNKNSDSAESGEKKNDSYKYKSDESYGSSEKLSKETHDQTSERTTLRPKKKKKKKSTVYMYMQGLQRQYTDSEEGSRRSIKALRHQDYNDKNEASRNNDKNIQTITKKRVSEDYIDYENYRRSVPMFLPKRYFWKKDQLLDLGYFWFDGPQGHTPGPYQITY